MNVIFIISDTLRRDHLGCYGNQWIRTPNLDRLAAESVLFDHAYCASFPTVPNRLDVMTGRYTFTYFEWAPLPLSEVVLSEVLGEASRTTMFIADTPHLLGHGYNFSRGFTGFEWIRGQENDRWRTAPREVRFPCDPSKMRGGEWPGAQILRNSAARKSEADYYVARTMRSAAQWLEENHRDGQFFLYVDTFDPHEPWDPPRWYTELYDPGYEGEVVTYPRYAICDFLSQSELKHVRALYAGEVTLVDTWVGMLLRRVDELGLRDNTAIIFTTDHGFYHGEHGVIGKALIGEGESAQLPMYEEVAHIPLLVRAPRVIPGRNSSLVQPPDLMPTILELIGVECPPTVQGQSLVPGLEGGRLDREFAVSSQSLIHGPRARRWSTISTGEWTLLYDGGQFAPDQAATTSTVDSTPRAESLGAERFAGSKLFHIPTDPAQEKNLLDKHPDVARDLHAKHVAFLEQLGIAEEHLLYRRRPPV